MTESPVQLLPQEQTLDGTLGITIDDATEDLAHGHVDVTDSVRQPYGIVHGGALAAMAEKERSAVSDLGAFVQNGGLAYLTMMGAQPQAVGYGLTDSPAGLAGWMLVHAGFANWSYGEDPEQSPTRDDVLDNFSLYWLTNTAASSARIYWENRRLNLLSAGDMKSAEIAVPVAISVFLEDVLRPQEGWARAAFPSLIYFNEVERGAHFAAWEQPALFAEELRAAFKTLR